MVSNLKSWRDVWIEESSPKTEEIAKRDADIKRIEDEVEVLRRKKT